MIDNVCRVEPPAQADLEDCVIRGRSCESQESRRRRDLEKSNRLTAIGFFAFLQQRGQMILVDQLAGEADALVKPREMRRGIGVNLLARRLQPRSDERAGRAFAVRSRRYE